VGRRADQSTAPADSVSDQAERALFVSAATAGQRPDGMEPYHYTKILDRVLDLGGIKMLYSSFWAKLSSMRCTTARLTRS
jgi:hypothetical protein